MTKSHSDIRQKRAAIAVFPAASLPMTILLLVVGFLV
jgi:hypothetical protein